MDSNVISFEDGKSLLNKLFSEQIPVLAAFSSANGLEVHLRGAVDSISKERGLVVSHMRPPSEGAGFISVPLSDRSFTFSFGTELDLPVESRNDLRERLGDMILILSFTDSRERLVLMWKS
jgi:hypothetical protein